MHSLNYFLLLEIVNNNITTKIVINGADDENLPDYSELQIFTVYLNRNVSTFFCKKKSSYLPIYVF